MYSNTYTNTGKAKDVVGLIIMTVALVYAAEHSTEIVEGTIKLGKTVAYESRKLARQAMTKEVPVWSRDQNGEKYDTGMKMRVSRFQKTDAA